ncbi:MAG TPA: cytochrome c family protein [Candidatus Cybelea sp.]|nr:cytochrome c family protein [Candidatus Cybelea sp.]
MRGSTSMNGFELNKIIGAVLFCLLVIMSIRIVGDIIVHPVKLKENAYKVEVPKEEGAATAAAAAKPEPDKPIETLLAAADPKKGEQTGKVCLTCHTFDKGQPNKIGPNLYGIVGEKLAEVPNFSFSDAMLKKGGSWGYDELYQFLKSPKDYIPGTKMTFVGLPKAEDRANVIAFLRTLSDHPVPLPAAK